ncbi:serine/threonine-protein kinase [Kribbella sp. NPDC051137]|uniref:serine/threonine-protein kinase n=1 Tax=Kribbella sp. NPDC051137 TaxID=3155045 RepID=UPI00341E5152
MTERSLAGGRYVLGERPLGAGGMGTVWKAFDTVLHREVAVKELRIPDGLNAVEQDKLRMRALREARAAAGLDHPAIVTIHDVIDEGGRPWIVMKLLPGRSLDQVVQAHGPLSPRRAAELGVRLIEALSAAHGNGVLHRDVKPQNLMLGGDDRWMLTDFGIASVAGATRTLTGTGIVTGTLGYVAPERMSGAEPGAPADLWALGATLYFAVEGRNAYDHDDLPAMIAAVLTRDPAPMRLAGPLAPVIHGLMQRDPAARLTAAAAREQLQAVAGGYPTFETPTQKISTGTKVLHTGPVPHTEPVPPAEPSTPALRAGHWLAAVLTGSVFTQLMLFASSAVSGMPYWIGGMMAGATVLGLVLGRVVARWFEGLLGTTAALTAAALLIGESIVGGAIVLEYDRPLPAAILCTIALFSFPPAYRLATSLLRAVAPSHDPVRLRKTRRRNGIIASVLGCLLVGACIGLSIALHLSDVTPQFAMSFLGGALALTALVALPTLRRTRLPRAPRAGVVTTVVILLVIPILVAVRSTVYAVQALDDFERAPDICTSTALSQKAVAVLLPDPPDLDESTYSDSVDCTWSRDDSVGGLWITVYRYGNERIAARRIAERKHDDGGVLLDLADGGLRQSDSYSDSAECTVVVRIDNLLLKLELTRPSDAGEPDAQQLITLAEDLLPDIQSQR